MNKPLEIYKILENHVPENAVHYCFDLWEIHSFVLKIARSRNSKLGDYRYNSSDNSERISVNHNLHPYAFLITYLHEVAHLQAYKEYGRKINPHGKEWKITFSRLLDQVTTDLIFPSEVLNAIHKYKKSPKATSGGDHALTKALNQFNLDAGVMLSEIDDRARFILNKKTYQKGGLRRTRYLCKEVNSGKRYLISRNTVVKLINNVQ